MIKYCAKCLLPSTKPDLSFDNQGVCSACLAFENRSEIDWESRKLEFIEICNRYKSESSSNWDCIIPVSGGKDSTFQVLKVLEFGLKPLCVTATTCHLTPIGRKNILNIRNLGVDSIELSPNPEIRKKLNRYGLEVVGDISWPEHVGIFTIPVRVATSFKVPLIVWGENSQHEYGGPAASQQSKNLDRAWLEEFGGLLGLRVSDLTAIEGVSDKDLIYYNYPSDKQLAESGVTGIFLGYFFPWDGLSNALIAQANGFTSFGNVVEGSMVDYENVDNFQTGIHDYFKYLKYGFGRATDIASLHIRRGRFTRDQGLEIVKRLDGVFPATYLGKPLEEILKPLDITVSKFMKICDEFTNANLFQRDSSGKFIRRLDGSPLKLNYDNLEF
jgi:N-acetyl sugar amidotransferase